LLHKRADRHPNGSPSRTYWRGTEEHITSLGSWVGRGGDGEPGDLLLRGVGGNRGAAGPEIILR